MENRIPDSANYHINREYSRQIRGAETANALVNKGLSADLDVKTTVVYKYLEESDKEISVFQGGSRSGKTVNIIIWFIIKLLGEQNKVLSICRASLPTIRGTVLRDFKEQMEALNLWDDNCFNSTQLTYDFNGNLVEFISTDQPQKIRGRKRNYLFINECNEVEKEAALQLLLRTTEKIVMDFNPSDDEGWWYDYEDGKDPNADFYITTFLDNPFLEDSLVQRIQNLQFADENYWRIYGLGMKGIATHKIYQHWRTVPRFPQDCEDVCFGVDFGYNSPTAMVRVGFKDNMVFAHEEIYERKMTTGDFIARLDSLNINRTELFYCDSAAAESIEELIRAGVNAIPATKDVLEGIRKVKSMPLYITEYSINFIDEIKKYCWMLDPNGAPIDKPVKHRDHLLDALRYSVITHQSIDQEFWGVI
jgi:phage terminase large subunit